MDKEDLYSIIAYIKTLTPISNTPPRSALKFPMNIIVHTIPSPATPGKRPDTTNVLAYGAYMINAANCRDCHSPMVKGKFVPGQEFSGGMAFPMPGGITVRTANITPDVQTGIGTWTKEMFIARFKMALDKNYAHQVKKGDPQSIMPWGMYAQMENRDLGAIYTYLRSVKPVKKSVTKYQRQ